MRSFRVLDIPLILLAAVHGMCQPTATTGDSWPDGECLYARPNPSHSWRSILLRLKRGFPLPCNPCSHTRASVALAVQHLHGHEGRSLRPRD